jgi:hypothetical protein
MAGLPKCKTGMLGVMAVKSFQTARQASASCMRKLRGPRAVLHLQGYVAIERVRSTPGDKDLGDGQERPPSCKQRVAATAANAIQPLLALIDFAY